MTSNIADYRVTLDGVDLSPSLKGRTENADPAKRRPRLVSLSIAQRRGEEPDKLTIVIDDSDGKMAIPAAGKLLHVQIGWRQGSEVTIGLRDKGSFKVDSVTHEGPPDLISIEASSADMTGAMRTRREEGHHETTLGAIVSRVAGRHGLKPVCAPALAGIAIKAQAQSRESDTAFLRRLGREHDAVATVKNGRLILSPIGAATTPSGKAFASVTIRRRDGDWHSYRVDKQEEVTGVTAVWHDRKGAKRQEVTTGKTEGARKLRRVHASEAEARAAAKAEQTRAARAPVSLDLTLSLGRPDLAPEQRVTTTGFKSQIDHTKWLISEVTDVLDNRGYTTQIKLQSVTS
jgi:phage protein D